MEFRILGPLEVRRGEESLRLGGMQQRALLAILLLHANTPVTIDRLIEELWPERPPATAAHTVRVYVSNLRKLLGHERLVTSGPGYLIRVERDELDLERFERLAQEGREALGTRAPDRAAAWFADALALWRGEALADFVYEPFAQGPIARLQELRLTALEDRLDADLASGRHTDLVGELQALVAEHRLRERPRGQLMLALYRSGRQAEALEVFQQTRRLLVDELGIEPSPALQELERAILRQDSALASETPAVEPRMAAPTRSILLGAADEAALDRLLRFAEPLATGPAEHELVLAWILAAGSPLAPASAALNERRANLAERHVAARAATFRSAQPGTDLVRLASEQDVDLVVLDGEASFDGGRFLDDAVSVLADAPCDVAILFDRDTRPAGPVLVPFGAGEHEWGALELAAWYARALGIRLILLGTTADDDAGRPDASRLLAHAALAVQRLAGVATEALLADPGEESVLAAAAEVALLVVGLPDDWERGGLGDARTALASRATPPTVLVRHGLRPGGLAPGDTLTRFTWSLSSAQLEPVADRQSASA
jgi:DNA-binding SARP family transcriptional activator